MKLLIIDNYDSFTYNLVHFLGELGAEPVVFRNDKITLDQIAALAPAGIVLSPGPCTPNEAGICLACVTELSGTFPILGVCLGHQAIGEAYGGKVVRAKRAVHGKTSRIAHDGSELAVTISAGWATWEGEAPDELLRRADDALYEAKRAGRDRVEGAPATVQRRT